MVGDALLLLLLALLAWCGSRVASRACRVRDPALAAGLGLPLGLSAVLLVAGTLARFLPLWACLALAVALALGAARAARQREEDPEVQEFSPAQRWLIVGVLGASLFYLHTTQLARPEDDFWIHYPVTRSLLRGNIPPVNPYFPDLPLQGHYGRHLLLATLSLPEGGDTLRTQWILEFALMVNSVFLWATALRRATGSARAGALGTLLVFMGVNVGSRVGLLDAYDNNNLLVYLLLAALFGLLAEILARAAHREVLPRALPVAAGLVAGVLGAVYETHLALALGALLLSTAVVAWRRRREGPRLARAVAAIVGLAVVLALLQGGTLQSLAARALTGDAQPARSAGEQNQSQHVTVRFPKEPFLSIRLGPDVYQRLSFAMDTALFRRYRPVLDEGGYAFAFGPKVLVLHWLPTWLAPLTLAWAFWRRSLGGLLLGSFAALAYLVPALFDFGPVHEMEYFRWEFAAGVGFAALLAMAVADLWERRPAGLPGILVATALVLLVLVDLVGAQRRINDLAIELQRNPDLLARTFVPWYPSTERWMLEQPSLGLQPADLEAARWLWTHSKPGDRVLTDFRSDGHESMLWEAAMGGLSGTFTVGHALPPTWLTVGVAPYLPAQPTIAFRQTMDPETLAGLGVDWILLRGDERPQGLNVAADVGVRADRRHLYRLGLTHRTPGPLDLGETGAVTATVEGLPDSRACQSGVAYPITVRLSQPLDGWLAYAQVDAQGAVANRLSPVTARIQGSEVRTWYVPPMEEGEYRLGWAFAADEWSWLRLEGEVPAAYAFSAAVEESLRVEHLEVGDDGSAEAVLVNAGRTPFDTGAPVRLQWWVWDPEKHGFRVPFAPEGEKEVPLALAPGQSLRVKFLLDEPLPPGGRVDLSVAARVGPPVPVAELHASFMGQP